MSDDIRTPPAAAIRRAAKRADAGNEASEGGVCAHKPRKQITKQQKTNPV